MGKALRLFVRVITHLSALGVICFGRDIDLIADAWASAVSHDAENVGDGIRRVRWGWDTFPRQQYTRLFRFRSREDIESLMDALQFPEDEYWKVESGATFTREEAMLLYLRRMSYPSNYIHLSLEGFCAQRGALSELLTKVQRWIFLNHTHRLLRTGMTKWAARVPEYARVVGEGTLFTYYSYFVW